MKSSGTRRGLAVAAIGALAAVGLPLAAQATPLSEQTPADAITLMINSTDAEVSTSVKPDGTDSTTGLVATADSEIANVTFQYSPDAGVTWINIATVGRNSAGAFEHDWAYDAALYEDTVSIRAIGDTTSGAANPRVSNVNAGMVLHGPGNPTIEAFALTNSPDIGVFQLPGGGYFASANGDAVALNGTTSAPMGSYFDAGRMSATTGNFTGGLVSGAVMPGAGATRQFQAVVNIAGYTYDGVAPIEDQIAFYAGGNQGGAYTAAQFSQDVEAYSLYKQTITSITTTPAGPSTTIPDGTTQNVVVTVLDQNGKPMAGVHVQSEAGTQGFTNGLGQFTFAAQAAGPHAYHADATSTAGYNPGSGDKQATLTIDTFVPRATTLVASSADGAAFDFDENAAGDITVQVKNQNGGNFDPTDVAGTRQDVRFSWKITPFNGNPVVNIPVAAVDAEAAGKYDIPFPAGQPEGFYELSASLTGDGGGNNAIANAVLATYQAGQANVFFDGFEPQIADVNSTATISGELVLDNGTPLPNRRLGVAWTRGAAGDGDDPAPDTTLVEASPITANGAGQFTAHVKDIPDGPELSELGGFLTVTGAVTPGIGNSFANGAHGVDFTTNVIPAGAKLQIDNSLCPNDPLISDDLEPQCAFFNESFDPGNVQQIEGLLTAADGVTPLKGRRFNLTVDKGFFLDFRVSAGPPSPVIGPFLGLLENLTDNAYFPDWNEGSHGQTIEVSTNSAGEIFALTSIERDAGFDDDGRVTQKVTGTAGTATNDAEVLWDTVNNSPNGDAINIDEISVVETPGEQQQPVRTFEDIVYDLYAFDQYGNKVRGVNVNVNCAVDMGEDDPCPAGGFSLQSDFDNGGDLFVDSTEPGTFEFIARTTYANTRLQQVLVNDPDSLVVNTANEQIETSFTGEWYELDFATATYTMNPADGATTQQPVGTPFNISVTVLDSEGNPVENVRVDLSRTSDLDDDDTRFTNENGVATFGVQGDLTQCGEPDTFIASIFDFGGILAEELSTTVEFTCEKAPITASLGGDGSPEDKPANRNVLDISATTAIGEDALTGAPVKVFKRVDGEWVRIARRGGHVLDSTGKVSITVVDGNGNRRTRYYAEVGETALTLGDNTNVLTLR